MDKHSARADLRCRVMSTLKRILQQGLSQALALFIFVHRQPGQQDDTNWMCRLTLRDSL